MVGSLVSSGVGVGICVGPPEGSFVGAMVATNTVGIGVGYKKRNKISAMLRGAQVKTVV